jgi:hypothetical protein
LEKEAVENAGRRLEEIKREQMQAEQDKTRRKPEAEREEQMIQRRRVTDEGMCEFCV